MRVMSSSFGLWWAQTVSETPSPFRGSLPSCSWGFPLVVLSPGAPPSPSVYRPFLFAGGGAFPQTAPTDDAFFQPELGWSAWGSLGWTKTADGLNWRMPDRLGSGRIAAMLVYRLWTLSCKKNQKGEGPARALPVAAPMPKSDSF